MESEGKPQYEYEPLWNDPDCAQEFYHALGWALVWWGKLEHMLDTILQIAENVRRDIDGLSRKAPTHFKQKIEYLTDLTSCGELAKIGEKLKAIFSKLQELAGVRNVLFHSTVSGWDMEGEPKLKLSKMDNRRGETCFSSYRISIGDIDTFSHEVERVHWALSMVAIELCQLQRPPFGRGVKPLSNST